MTRVFIDTGHGQNNRSPGVWDSGAVGSGVQEAQVVREVAPKAISLLTAAGIDARLAPDGSINSRCTWQRATLKPDDLFVSLHLNSGATSGTSVYYATARPQLRAKADLAAATIAKVTGLKDEGGVPDIRAAVKKIGVLNAHPTATTFLFELCRIGHADGVRVIRERGAEAVAAAVCALLGVSPAPADPLAHLTPEQRAAWLVMRDMEVFSQFTKPDTVIDAKTLGVVLERYLRAIGK